MINNVEAFEAVKLRVTTGLRTYAEQDTLYAQGRPPPGNIVTNARGGESYHNFGLAVDVVPLTDTGGIDWAAAQLSDGWNTIGSSGTAEGLEWGGNWETFVDRPHFQDTLGGLTTQQLDTAMTQLNQIHDWISDRFNEENE